MKKKSFILFALFVIGIPMITNAQSFGLQAGLNLSNFSMKDDIGKYETKSIPGYNIGLLFKIYNGTNISVEMGAKIATYGVKRTDIYYQYSTEYKIKSSNIEIPIYARKEFPLNNNINLMALAGGYVSYGLSGTFYEDGNGTNISWSEDAELGEVNLKRTDFGAIIGIGVIFNSIQLMANYQLGLKNLSFETDDDTKINNRVLGISLVYYFNKK